MTKKIDPMDALHSDDKQLRNAAIVYLHEVRSYTAEIISEATSLCISTVKTYFRKFLHLLDWAKDIFTKAKNYVRKNVDKFWVYIDKITMPNGEVWCKIGQTTRDPCQRAKELSWKSNGIKIKPLNVEVQEVIECKDLTAMCNMEDCLRLGMSAISPQDFCPNDRLLRWADDYPQRILNNQFVKIGLTQFAAWHKITFLKLGRTVAAVRPFAIHRFVHKWISGELLCISG